MTDFTTDIYVKVAEEITQTKAGQEFDEAMHMVLGDDFEEKVDILSEPVTSLREEWFKIGFKTAFQFMAEQYRDFNIDN